MLPKYVIMEALTMKSKMSKFEYFVALTNPNVSPNTR